MKAKDWILKLKEEGILIERAKNRKTELRKWDSALKTDHAEQRALMV